MKRALATAGIVSTAALAALAIACGGNAGNDSPGSDSGDAADQAVTTVQARRVSFQPDVIRVKLGVPFELRLENLDGFEHDLQAPDLPIEIITGGSDRPEHAADGHGAGPVLALHTMANETMSGVFVARERGTFDIWCTLPGHKDQGMIGTIVVE